MSWKAQARRLINRVLEPAGFTLRRFQPEMRVREMISPQVRARQITAFRAAMAQSLAAFPELAQRLPPEADIRSFTEALPHCPVMQDTGGGGFPPPCCSGPLPARSIPRSSWRAAPSAALPPGCCVRPPQKRGSTPSTSHLPNASAWSPA